MTVVGAGDGAPREVTLAREIIRTDSVKSDILEPGYGYLRISQFQARTGEQVEDALTELRDHHPLGSDQK